MLEDLKKKKRFQDAEAAVLGYLKHMPKGVQAQHWLYGTLALAIKVNGGKPERVRDALGYSAILAEATGNVNYILTAADLLFEDGDLQPFTLKVDGKAREVSVGALIDAVARKTPHRPQPLLMSMNLARRLRDPKRMAAAVEAVFALGWPGMDEAIRRRGPPPGRRPGRHPQGRPSRRGGRRPAGPPPGRVVARPGRPPVVDGRRGSRPPREGTPGRHRPPRHAPHRLRRRHRRERQGEASRGGLHLPARLRRRLHRPRRGRLPGPRQAAHRDGQPRDHLARGHPRRASRDPHGRHPEARHRLRPGQGRRDEIPRLGRPARVRAGRHPPEGRTSQGGAPLHRHARRGGRPPGKGDGRP